MGLSVWDTVWVGSSLALGSFFYLLYRRQREALLRIQAAPRLQVNAALRTLLETTKQLDYVVLEGRVEAIGKALHSEIQSDFLAVIQKRQVTEHRLLWSSLTSSWTEYARVIHKSVKEIPFQLCPLENNEGAVLVCEPLKASGLILQTVHHQFFPASLRIGELLGHYLTGEKPAGLLETEEILPVGAILTGLGKLTLNSNGEITLEPPQDGLDYILSLAEFEDILHEQESMAGLLRGAALFFGALSAVVILIILYRAYRKNKEKKRQENHWIEEQLYYLQYEEEQVDPERLCVICISRERECVILPCGHVCCCFMCYEALPSHRCPICRCRIKRVVPLYQT
ncbi:mitochondrial ubiquitin ligase activator of nfkb 1-A-like [Gastrophryne carolinensis]